MFIEHGPIKVYEGEEKVYRWNNIVKFNGYLAIIWSFQGLDRGDIVEMDTEVWDHDLNFPLYLSSTHKEDLGNFDAWDHHYPVVNVDYVRISFLCRYNGPNALNPSKGYVRPHWGVHLL
jgi:hypothetical protein